MLSVCCLYVEIRVFGSVSIPIGSPHKYSTRNTRWFGLAVRFHHSTSRAHRPTQPIIGRCCCSRINSAQNSRYSSHSALIFRASKVSWIVQESSAIVLSVGVLDRSALLLSLHSFCCTWQILVWYTQLFDLLFRWLSESI